MRAKEAVLLLGLAALGCNSADAANWGGTMTDSAGVAMVTNPAEGDWSVQAAPVVTQALDIGAIEGEDAYQFAQVVALDVAPNGDILVLDQRAAQVRIFDAAGKHLRSVGKPGGGPGEFSPMTMAVRAGPGDTVYVADLGRQRIAALAGDGTEAASFPVMIERGIPIRFQPAPGGRLAMQVRRMQLPGAVDTTTPMRDFIIVTDPAGQSADTIAELESGKSFNFGGERMEMKIFSSEPMWALLEDGRVVRGRNDDYRLEVFSTDGKLERVITRPFEKKAVSLEDQNTYRNLMRAAIKQQGAQVPPEMVEQLVKAIQFADNFPVYASFIAGPNNTIWVQRYPTDLSALGDAENINLEDLTAPDWDVFDAEGRLLGMVTLPARFNPLRVVGSSFYGTQLDDLDVQHVVRLDVRM